MRYSEMKAFEQRRLARTAASNGAPVALVGPGGHRPDRGSCPGFCHRLIQPATRTGRNGGIAHAEKRVKLPRM